MVNQILPIDHLKKSSCQNCNFKPNMINEKKNEQEILFFYHFIQFQQVSLTRNPVLRPVRSFSELTTAKGYIDLVNWASA